MGTEKIGNSEIETRLTSSGVRISPVRLLIMRELLKSERPLSAQELEYRLDTVDRSSITRTLSTFLKAHLIHSISDGSGAVRYEACNSTLEDQDTDEHAHFHCSRCGATVCLDSIPVPKVELPEGFKEESASFIITGLCPHCTNSAGNM